MPVEAFVVFKGKRAFGLQLRRKTSPKIQGSLGHFFAARWTAASPAGSVAEPETIAFCGWAGALALEAFCAVAQLKRNQPKNCWRINRDGSSTLHHRKVLLKVKFDSDCGIA